ncbi:MAG: hypothetical protein WD823_04010 [Sulfuricaulis sp.]|uniref:hypothetical protein n=1 Tax=Sulfuricaulis sp. TaxID=2003553 RepID=UPI0034A391BC
MNDISNTSPAAMMNSNATPDLATQLNRNCLCHTLDSPRLAQALGLAPDAAALAQPPWSERPHAFSATPVFVSAAQARAMTSTIQAIESAVHLPGYREQALARAPASARLDPGPRGVFLGYDFHLDPGGPRLIEINTNAGGALLVAALAQAQRACCNEAEAFLASSGTAGQIEHSIVEMFLAEWRLSRGEQTLRRIAIVDDAPAEQYLYPEFLLFRALFERHRLEAVIADARELVWRDGALWHGEQRIDLVYNRLTDFYLTAPEHAALRAAYEAGAVVLTPHPRAHALYADKRNLVRLSDPDFLRALDLPATTIEILTRGVPRTVAVNAAHAEALWVERRRYFFKPAAGYGSKAAYRGDKLTKRVWSEILGADYVAQETVPPSERALHVKGDTLDLKLDIRAYVYDGAIQALAARLYQGQTTNFRTPGGGFAPVVVAPDNAATTFAAWPDATGHDFEFSNL